MGPKALSDMSLDGLIKHFQDSRPNSVARIRVTPRHSLLSLTTARLPGVISRQTSGAFTRFNWLALRFTQSNRSVEAHGVDLAKMTWDATKSVESLSTVPFQDFSVCVRLFGRYGRFREMGAKSQAPKARAPKQEPGKTGAKGGSQNKRSQEQLSKRVSAKGPSFSFANCELNSHACIIAQTTVRRLTLQAVGRAAADQRAGSGARARRGPPGPYPRC